MGPAPLMMDVDTGVDDAAAIAYALGMGADLVAISTVAGNVGIDLATDNTLRVLELLGAGGVPVFRGASRPLIAEISYAPYVHGEDGLAGASLPETSLGEQDLTAPEAISAMAEEFAGELVFVSVGPVTNLAMALSLRPRIVEQIARVVIMGGVYFGPGNKTPYSEFNAYSDPDALHQVYQAGWSEVIGIGLDVTMQVEITEPHWKAIPEDAEGAAGLVRGVSEYVLFESDRRHFYLHDPLAVAVALDPSLVTLEPYAVTVETGGERRGQTVVRNGGNVSIAKAVDADRFLRRFCQATSLPAPPAR